MITGMTLNIFNNHAERVKMANLAQTVNVLQAVILTEGEKLILTPTYHVLKMYAIHQDAQLIPVNFESPNFKKMGESLPAISISLVNIDNSKAHEVSLDVSKLGLAEFEGSILVSNALQDHNDFDNPGVISPKPLKKVKVKNGMATLQLPPFSVVVIKETN